MFLDVGGCRRNPTHAQRDHANSTQIGPRDYNQELLAERRERSQQVSFFGGSGWRENDPLEENTASIQTVLLSGLCTKVKEFPPH